ncbi:MAG TPA: type VII secretion protein EssC [Candidatus Limiplasma sp.]|nr:type VII secretion protein EssC [Candidatus Limiplasma sp.]
MYCIWLYWEDRYRDILLPEQTGFHTSLLLSSGDTGWQNDVRLSIRCLDGDWFLTMPEGFQCEGESPGELCLGGHLILKNKELTIAVYSTQIEKNELEKYVLPPERTVLIGRNPNCTLRMDSPLVTATHGALTYKAGGWFYSDTSRNGTFLNHRKVNNGEYRLKVCDELFFAPGLKFVFLGDHIALNHPVQLAIVGLPPWVQSVPEPLPEEQPSVSAITEIHRAPRMLVRPDDEAIEIDPPISKAPEREQSLFMTIGPSLTMVLPMMMGAMMTSMISNGSNFMLAGLTMIGTSSILAVIWGTASFKRQKKLEKQTEIKRKKIYVSYIKEAERHLRQLYQKEYNRLLNQNPSFQECIDLLDKEKLRFWERQPGHDDFLCVRLGLGEAPLPNEIHISKEPLSLIDDSLRSEPERLVQTYSVIKNAPLSVNLRSEKVVGILGSASAQAIIISMMIQISVLQSYHDVKIAIISDEQNANQWSWARWLPHVFPTEDRNLRMVASQPAAVREVLMHLNEILQMRLTHGEETFSDEDDPKSQPTPHYVVFCLVPAMLETEAVFNRLALGAPGFTLVVAAPHMEELPKECRLVLSAGQEHSGIYSSVGDVTPLDYDRLNPADAFSFVRRLAPMRVRDSVMGAAIPSVVSFLELYGVRDVKHLNVWRSWNERHAFEGLESTIGLRAGAQPFILDISDKKHGPHGLVAGTTGSGKSVMLQTYILSLATRYHPRDVQFILIDYKGGGMSDAFQGLPHVAGTIDNLQGIRMIRRALASVQGEIRRREAIFKAVGVSNVDDYMRQYQTDPQLEPLSHLIIIIDEFAELKKEQPDFMRELISASRVGRSVGIHLILATQKPGNSVDDEIWSNARFRICLRVQNRSDSLDMLKRPDASYIKGMGRCFVQIGNDEIFEEVQTSWSGATYEPTRSTSLEKPRLLNEVGQPVYVKLDKDDASSKVTQIAAVLENIRETAAEHQVPPSRRLWLDELPPHLDLLKIEPVSFAHWTANGWPQLPSGTIVAPVGLADDLQNQRRVPVMLDFTRDKNHLVVGLAATGKTTFLQTLTLSLALRYTPEQVQIYALSLTSKTLGTMKNLPHMGDIVYGDDPDDVFRLIHMLTKENERRRGLFAEAATDNYTAFIRSCDTRKQFERVPAIVVLIDGIAQLLEIVSEDEPKQRLFTLLKEGSSRGLFFVVTALSTSELPSRMLSNFHGVALRLHDRSDYQDVVGKRMPSDMSDILSYAGRGVVALEDDVFEMQTAVCFPQAVDADRAEGIGMLADQMRASWKGKLPKHLPHIAEDATWNLLQSQAEVGGYDTQTTLAVGYKHIDAEPACADLYKQYAWLIIGPHGSGKTSFLKAVAAAFARKNAEINVFTAENHRNDFSAANIRFQPLAEQESYLKELDQLILDRNNRRKAIMSQGEKALRELYHIFTPYVLIIDGLQDAPVSAPLRHRLTECASMAEGFGLYLFATLNPGDLSLLRRDPLTTTLGSRQNGIALCKLADCDLWELQIPFATKNRMVRHGDAYWVNRNNVERLVLPMDI